MFRPEIAIILLTTGALAGCGGETAGPVRPGEWEITTTAGPPNGRRIDQAVTKRCLRAKGDDPTRKIVLELIGRDSCEVDKVTVADGRIGGVLQCPEYYSFSAHEEPVAGRYSANAVDLTVDMPLFGQVLRQSVKARRVGDC